MVLHNIRLESTSLREILEEFNVVKLQDFIYWTDWNTGDIVRANKMTGLNRTRIHERLEHVTDILVFHASRQAGWNLCAVNNGGCSHLCLAMPNPGGPPGRPSTAHRCACPTHYTLSNNTCIRKLNQ
jgi:low density lipoprotein receptor-related protein 5/6